MFIAVGVFSVALLAYQVSMVCAANSVARIALFIYLMQYWVECMTSSVISFAYFTQFSNLNISGTDAGIFKR